MGFWIFMLIMNILVPFTMIGIGTFFSKSGGPKKINTLSGYRTSMSMKNKDTWVFAHKYCGKLWTVIGLIMLPLSVGAMLFVMGDEMGTVGTVGLIVCVVQLIFLILPIAFTEKALKKTFDKYGERRV